MELVISWTDETNLLTDEDLDLVKSLLTYAVRSEQLTGVIELSLSFVTNEQIRLLNHQYRNVDEATDVISFALEELSEGEIEVMGDSIPRVLGDIVISVPQADEQAKKYEHSFQRELGFLVIHGLLHLLGYRHDTEENENIMFTKQKEILEGYGLKR